MTCAHHTQADSEATLWAWCARHGVIADGIELRRVNGLRGLYATRAFDVGQTVLHVPREIILTQEHAQESAIGRRALASCPDLGPGALMALYLLHCKVNATQRQEHIRSMPPSYEDHALSNRRAAREWLRGSCAMRTVDERFKSCCREYRRLRKALGAEFVFRFRDYLWARLSVGTRVFETRFGQKLTLAAVPLADMANTATSFTTIPEPGGDGGFDLVAVRRMAAGDEVTCSYGALPNALALGQYGFAMEDNEFDIVRLRFRFAPSHHFWRLCNEPWTEERSFDIARWYDHRGTSNMFSMLRLACLPDYGTAAGVGRSIFGTFSRLPPVDAATERSVLRLVERSCEIRLAEFPDPIDTDEALLKQGGLSGLARDAVITRRGEKRILQELLSMARSACAALALGAEDRMTALAKLADGNRRYASYVDELRRMVDEGAQA